MVRDLFFCAKLKDWDTAFIIREEVRNSEVSIDVFILLAGLFFSLLSFNRASISARSFCDKSGPFSKFFWEIILPFWVIIMLTLLSLSPISMSINLIQFFPVKIPRICFPPRGDLIVSQNIFNSMLFFQVFQ